MLSSIFDVRPVLLFYCCSCPGDVCTSVFARTPRTRSCRGHFVGACRTRSRRMSSVKPVVQRRCALNARVTRCVSHRSSRSKNRDLVSVSQFSSDVAGYGRQRLGTGLRVSSFDQVPVSPAQVHRRITSQCTRKRALCDMLRAVIVISQARATQSLPTLQGRACDWSLKLTAHGFVDDKTALSTAGWLASI